MDSVADTSADRLVIDEDEPMDETPVGIGIDSGSTSSAVNSAKNNDVDVTATSSSVAHNEPTTNASIVANHETLLAPPPRVKSEPLRDGEATSPDSDHISASNGAQKSSSSSSKTTDATRSANDSKSSSKSKRKKSKSSSVEHDGGGPGLASVKSEPGAFATSSVVFDTNGISTPPPPTTTTTTATATTTAQQQPVSQQPSAKAKKKKLSMTPAAKAGDGDDTCAPLAAKKPKTTEKHIAQEKLERRDASTWVRTVASSTDPESLGPCEPGSHVVLEGVVWNETATGVLVVNVTWRGKSYVGTLLDSTRHDWAPPRVCESPLLDLERTPAKGRNGKRNNRSSLCHSASTSDLPLSASTNQNKNNHKKKTSKAGQLTVAIPPPTTGNSDEDSLSSLPAKPPTIAENVLEPLSPVLRPCPCEHCDKRFAEPVAMKYHQSAAHPKPPSPVPVPVVPLDTSLMVASCSANGASSSVELMLTTEELEKASLAALFNVVVEKNTASTSRTPGSDDLPKLEPPTQPEVDRSTRTPGAYSDISDDGAPLLEKETAGDKTGQSPKKATGDKLRSSTPNSMPNGTAGDGTPPQGSPLPVTPSSSSSNHSKRSSSSNTETPQISSAITNGVAGTLTTTSETPSSLPSSKPITTSVTTSSPASNFIPAVGPAVPGPMLPAGLVMPFGTPTSSFGGSHASPFQRPPFSVLPPFGHGLFVPQMPPPPSPNLSSNKPVQHKIHELTSAASSPPSAGTKSLSTTSTITSTKGSADVVVSPSVIPPVQRHLHMHQHTHSFPLFPSPGLDYATNPYAATAAMFGHNGTPINLAYPPK